MIEPTRLLSIKRPTSQMRECLKPKPNAKWAACFSVGQFATPYVLFLDESRRPIGRLRNAEMPARRRDTRALRRHLVRLIKAHNLHPDVVTSEACLVQTGMFAAEEYMYHATIRKE